MKRLILLLIAFSFVCSANICMAEDSLEAKLAKLEAESKVEQSSNEIVIEKTVSKNKTLAQRIDELEAQQKAMQDVDEGIGTRMSALEGKLVALENVSKEKPGNVLLSRIAELENKVKHLETSSGSAKVDAQQINDNGIVSELELKAGSLEASSELDMYELAPVAANFLETTSVDDENAVSIDITADYFGKYIWRGQNINDDPVFQPGVSFGWNGFTAGWWGSMDTTTINNNRGEFIEHDYYLDYSGDVPFVDGVGYSVGVINYYFPSAEDTTEVYWGFGFDLPLSPSITFYHDIDDVKGTYASFGLSHSIERIAELGPDMPIAMDIGASLGWGSGSYNKSYWSGGDGVTSSKLNDLALSLSFPVEIAGWTVAPSINYVTIVSDAVRDTDTYNDASDYFFAGVSLSKSF